jgi:hypothetical protein
VVPTNFPPTGAPDVTVHHAALSGGSGSPRSNEVSAETMIRTIRAEAL